MKTMTCNQLGGACEQSFSANSFEEMAGLSKSHGMEMYQAGDQPHLEAMEKMMALMQQPEGMQKWFDAKRAEFDALAED